MAIANSSSAANQAGQLQLHDIHVPEQVSNFPIAPGWWVLLTLIVLTMLWLYKKHKKDTQLNADKKQALVMLDSNESPSAKECIALLKWAAMQYFSRQQLAKLYGKSFQDFLVKQLPEKHQDNFTQLSQAAFDSQYQAVQGVANAVDHDCHQATRLWLNHALPIQKSLITENKTELGQ